MVWEECDLLHPVSVHMSYNFYSQENETSFSLRSTSSWTSRLTFDSTALETMDHEELYRISMLSESWVDSMTMDYEVEVWTLRYQAIESIQRIPVGSFIASWFSGIQSDLMSF